MANYSEDATQPESSLENSEQPSSRLTEHSELGVLSPMACRRSLGYGCVHFFAAKYKLNTEHRQTMLDRQTMEPTEEFIFSQINSNRYQYTVIDVV